MREMVEVVAVGRELTRQANPATQATLFPAFSSLVFPYPEVPKLLDPKHERPSHNPKPMFSSSQSCVQNAQGFDSCADSRSECQNSS